MNSTALDHGPPSPRLSLPIGAFALGAAATFAAGSAAFGPRYALILLLGGGAVLVCLLRIDIAVMVLAATAPLETEFSNLAGTSITKLVGALCLGSFAVEVVRRRRRLHFDRSHVVVLGLLAIAMISTLQARDEATAVTATLRYASFAAVYIILAEVADRRELVRRVVWALSLASTIAAYIALQNYLGERTVVATLKNSNATDFAFILVTTLPLTFWLLGTKRRWLRPVVIAMIATMCAAAALSLSRSAVVGVSLGLLVFVITDRRRVPLVVGGGILAILAAVTVIHSNPARFQNALLYKEKVADVNVSTRLDAWHAAAKLAADHPLLGIGPGNFKLYFTEATGRPPGTYNILVVHDAYLDVAAELGFVAAVLFLLYLGIVFARLWGVTRLAEERSYAQALHISLVIAATCSIFISEQYFLPFWLIGGLATAVWRSAREAAPPTAAAAAPALAPAVATVQHYDGAMETGSTEQRERRLRDEFAATRAQKQRLRQVELDVAKRERALQLQGAALEETATRLSALTEELKGRELDLATREAVMRSEEASRAAQLAEEERSLAARERELERHAAEVKRESEMLREERNELQRRTREVWSRERALDPSRQPGPGDP